MLQVAFRYQHDCTFNDLSRRFPEVRFTGWCNFHLEALQFRAEDATAQAIHKELVRDQGRGYRILWRTPPGELAQTALLRCACPPNTNTDAIAGEAGCLLLQPTVYHQGWEHYRAVAFEESAAPLLVKRLSRHGKVELLSKKPLEHDLLTKALMVSAAELLSDLTSKQAAALLAAVHHGYYKVPRKVRTEDIARQRKVPRTTYEEHVRKAEGKIMHAMAPYLAMYLGGSPAKPPAEPLGRVAPVVPAGA